MVRKEIGEMLNVSLMNEFLENRLLLNQIKKEGKKEKKKWRILWWTRRRRNGKFYVRREEEMTNLETTVAAKWTVKLERIEMKLTEMRIRLKKSMELPLLIVQQID
jgi:hypothetical protein